MENNLIVNPFSEYYDEDEDKKLIREALAGSKRAMEDLCQRHQKFIYNIAWKMVQMPEDAKDITQEVMIKMITKISYFNHKSSFRTWLYRIVVNHFYDMKKTKKEQVISGFDFYGNFLENTPDGVMTDEEQQNYQTLIQEAKVGCSAGMLLCLDRQQRLVYILGDIFEVNHRVVSEILDISSENFRQRLTRARKDLHNFMQNKCGLVNRSNPCRCAKKTKSFIDKGLIDPDHLKFNRGYLFRINQVLNMEKTVCDTIDEAYAGIFQDHPFNAGQVYSVRKHLDGLLNREDLFPGPTG